MLSGASPSVYGLRFTAYGLRPLLQIKQLVRHEVSIAVDISEVLASKVGGVEAVAKHARPHRRAVRISMAVTPEYVARTVAPAMEAGIVVGWRVEIGAAL